MKSSQHYSHFIIYGINQSLDASVDLFKFCTKPGAYFSQLFTLFLDRGLGLGLEWQV